MSCVWCARVDDNAYLRLFAHSSRRRRFCFLFPAPPEITPFYFSELTEGSRVQVACTVHQGDLPLNLTWLKDGGPVYRGPGAAAVTPFNAYSTILTMNNVSRSDTGDYTCVAANPVHSATYTAHLNVNGTPKPQPFTRERGWEKKKIKKKIWNFPPSVSRFCNRAGTVARRCVIFFFVE